MNRVAKREIYVILFVCPISCWFILQWKIKRRLGFLMVKVSPLCLSRRPWTRLWRENIEHSLEISVVIELMGPLNNWCWWISQKSMNRVAKREIYVILFVCPISCWFILQWKIKRRLGFLMVKVSPLCLSRRPWTRLWRENIEHSLEISVVI